MEPAPGHEEAEEAGVAADRTEEQPDDGGSIEMAAEAPPTVVDLTETTKPSRRFYANLADL